MADYQPQKSDKFTFGLWTIQNTGRDPFGEPTRGPMTGLDVIAELGKRNVYSYEMHVEDLIPVTSSASEAEQIIREAKKRMTDYDIKCTNCGSNVFGHPAFKDGALTSHDPRVRQYTMQRYLWAIDVAEQLGCKLCNLWWGRDGAEVDIAKDPMEAVKRLREGLNYLQAYIDKQGYKNFRLAMEPKPNEPRGDIYMPTAGHGLALIATLNKPDNCGIVLELAHTRMAGLNAYHEVAQVLEVGKLAGIHLNSQKPLRYDQDLRFGAEDLKEIFLVVKLLEDSKWPGTRSFDAHAYRTADREEVWDFVNGSMRTYLILREKVQRFNADAEIQGLLKDLCGTQQPLSSHDQLKASPISPDELTKKKLHHEKIDQLLQEVLMGVR